MSAPPTVLFLNGCYGVGKSTVLDHIGDLLAAAGVSFSLIDVDWVHRSSPPAADDPRNLRTEAENMAAVWQNYRRAGPRQLVVCGVMSNLEDRDRYERALRMPLRSVRLVASDAVIEARLAGRYGDGRADSLQWHLDRYRELARRLESADLDELAIETDDRLPRDIARQIIASSLVE